MRAANRIRFEYINDTSHADWDAPDKEIAPIDIEVLGWTLSSTADSAYLMPHLNENWTDGLKGATQQALTVPSTYTTKNPQGTFPAENYYGGAWMLWLKQEAESTQNADSYDGTGTNPNYEWLTGYSVSAGTEYKPLEYSYGAPPHIRPGPDKKGGRNIRRNVRICSGDV